MKKILQTGLLAFPIKSKLKLIMILGIMLVSTKSFSQACGSFTYTNVISSNISTNLNSNHYYLSNDVEIIGNVSFNDIEMLIAPNTSITIKSGNTLRILGSHLYSCTELWKVISIETGGRLIIDKGVTHDNSLIEDAEKAVSVGINYTQSNNLLSGSNAIEIENTIFNRNKIGIDFNWSTWDYHATTLYTQNPVKISKTVFTCRDIPFECGSFRWVNLEEFKNSPNIQNFFTFPQTPNVLSEPFIDESRYSSFNSYAYLKRVGNFWQKSEIAIELIDVGLFDVTFWEMAIGTTESEEKQTNTIIIDNNTIGIKAQNANFSLFNTTYQKPLEYFKGAVACVGIDAERTKDGYYRIKTNNPNSNSTPNNAFFDIDYGISIRYYQIVNISNTDFRGVNGMIDNYDPNPDYRRSDHTIEIGTTNIENIEISNNTIYNTYHGINVTYIDPSFGTTPGSSSLNILNINNNQFKIYPNWFTTKDLPLNGGLLGRAINVESTVIADLSNKVININQNNIEHAIWGIITQNIQGNSINVKNNYVLLKDGYEPTSGTKYNQTGISSYGNIAGSRQANRFQFNTISTVQNFMPQTACLLTELSANSHIECNNISKAEYGTYVSGDNTPTKFWDNELYSSNTYGFTLANTGIIGIRATPTGPAQNGYFTCASNNKWLGSWGTNVTPPFKTSSILTSDARQSIFWVNTTNPLMNPSGSNFQDLLSIRYNLTNGSIQAASNRPNQSCRHCTGEEFNGFINSNATSSNSINVLSTEEEIALGSINITASKPTQRLYVMQHKLYQNLLADTATKNASVILQNFTANNTSNGFGIINQIANSINTADTATARSLIQNWYPINSIEENYKLYFNWQLSNFGNTQTNLTDIDYLANLCPFTDGLVVYAARTAYNKKAAKSKIFINNCGEPQQKYTQAKQMESTTVNDLNVKRLNVYPNPNKGSFLIQFPRLIESSNLFIYNIYGKLVFSTVQQKGATELKVLNKNLAKEFIL